MGEEEQHESHNSTNYINAKIVITAIVSVLLGGAFVLAMVNYGMNIQKRFDAAEKKEEQSKHVDEIIAVKYGAKTFDYSVPEGQKAGRYVLNKLGAGVEDKYYVIDNSDTLREALELVSSLSEGEVKLDVSDDFFISSSIIAVPVEKVDLADISIKSVTRDENYNIQIDAELLSAEGIDERAGSILFVQLENIQPKKVTVNLD